VSTLADLRRLRAEIDAVLAGLERLAPLVAVWEASQRPPEPRTEVMSVAGSTTHRG
jgi:hypothetical protein